MKANNHSSQRWLFIIAALICLIGSVTSLIIFRQSDIRLYPTKIATAYKQGRHQLVVPGQKDVNLKRCGAYGIYHIRKLSDQNYSELEIPPKIDCRLISKKTGEVIKAVPDYVKTNRFRLSTQSFGVLIMSITVKEPGTYIFSCDNLDEKNNKEMLVALGPNYFWEFLCVIWNVALPLFGGFSILCVTFVITSLLILAGLFLKFFNLNKSKNQQNCHKV